MLIQYGGHDEFLLTLDGNFRILIDPYNEKVGHPTPPLQADVVLVTHHHFDHDAVDRVTPPARVIDTPGTHTLAPGVMVQAVQVDHDPERGTLRGKNLMYRLEAEGLSLVHFGDLGVDLSTAAQADVDFDLQAASRLIQQADIWLIPIGGYYTIDTQAALRMILAYEPRVVIPMHYKTAVNESWPITTAEDFLAARPGWEACDLLRVTKEDLSCQPATAVLKPNPPLR